MKLRVIDKSTMCEIQSCSSEVNVSDLRLPPLAGQSIVMALYVIMVAYEYQISKSWQAAYLRERDGKGAQPASHQNTS
jgi:hypothetical protein